jgi:hypothetical protein
MCRRLLLCLSIFLVHPAVVPAQTSTPASLSNAAPLLQELGKQVQDTSL